ncbi:hypothetical protein LY622_13930 [Halomonas sp. M5N1S17]|uniref:hypothetical protein n=1 Tax=Halomonas alkalisoli TaxID=2907158 RepID=UPI001F33BC68|nr:hypothetical protein [Halomonas alkalisoli]MCE9664534.1 hypothetical protein [Halomonas alkalisoli]
MAQSDLNIANSDGATVRADINSQLEALVTQSSGPTSPPITFPYMRWFDTAAGRLKERNASNTAWIVVADDLKWQVQPIGVPFGIRDDLAGADVPPTDNANYRYIKLTASDAYNSGALTSESISGSAPLVVATAVIDFTDSPINGETVNLWNTEGRYPKAGTSPGTVANDQMQQITGAVSSGTILTVGLTDTEGAFEDSVVPGTSASFSSSTGRGLAPLDFNSENSPGARVGAYTDVKHQQVTYYMRIA